MLHVAGHQATPSGRLPDHGAKSGLPFPGWPAFLPIWQSSKASITTSSRPFGSSGRLQARKSKTRRVQAILAGTAFLPFRALGPVLHSGKVGNFTPCGVCLVHLARESLCDAVPATIEPQQHSLRDSVDEAWCVPNPLL